MRYIIISLFLFIIIMTGVASLLRPVDIQYINHSQTVCHGKSCEYYLLSQMNNRTINITEKEQAEICTNAEWSDCKNKYEIKLEDI